MRGLIAGLILGLIVTSSLSFGPSQLVAGYGRAGANLLSIAATEHSQFIVNGADKVVMTGQSGRSSESLITFASQTEMEADLDRFFWARVVSVPDGDTIEAVRRNTNLDIVKIRLYGLDAPEDGQPYGQKSARALRKMVDKKIISVEIIQMRDRYGRIVGLVRHEGQDVGRALAESGLVWVDPRFCKRNRPCRGYWAAVRQAQKNKTGLWREPATPPWEWRQR